LENKFKKKKKTEQADVIQEETNKLPFLTRARPYLIILPALLLTIGILYPFATAIWYSFTDLSFRSTTSSFIGIKNWVKMFSNVEFWHACWVTAKYAILTTGTEMIAGLGIALLLLKGNKFTKILRVVLIFPLMVAPVIATLIWQLMLSNTVGIVEKLLNVFSIYNFPWQSSANTALMTAGMIDFWVYTPFVTSTMMMSSKNTIHNWIAHVHIGRIHINFRT